MLHKTCQSGISNKNVFLFGTIFRHDALLVTEISRQNQNFRIIPRMCFCVGGGVEGSKPVMQSKVIGGEFYF